MEYLLVAVVLVFLLWRSVRHSNKLVDPEYRRKADAKNRGGLGSGNSDAYSRHRE